MHHVILRLSNRQEVVGCKSSYIFCSFPLYFLPLYIHISWRTYVYFWYLLFIGLVHFSPAFLYKQDSNVFQCSGDVAFSCCGNSGWTFVPSQKCRPALAFLKCQPLQIQLLESPSSSTSYFLRLRRNYVVLLVQCIISVLLCCLHSPLFSKGLEVVS